MPRAQWIWDLGGDRFTSTIIYYVFQGNHDIAGQIRPSIGRYSDHQGCIPSSMKPHDFPNAFHRHRNGVSVMWRKVCPCGPDQWPSCGSTMCQFLWSQVVAKVKWKGATGRNTGFCFVDFFGAKTGSATSTLGFAEASQPVRIQYVVWSVDPREKKIPRHTTHR